MKKGWETKTIGDVCEFQRGLTYAKGDEVDVSDNVVLRATNIDLTTNQLIFDELKYINDKVVVPGSKKVKKGSLMICTASGSKSHLGKVAFIDDDYGYAFGGFMGMLTPRNGLSPKYLFHLLTSEAYKDFIGALSDGANINNLTFDNLKRFPVPVPPLPEQQRIVGILDKAFAGIATAKANAEKNLQNARAIFESHHNSIFSHRREDWGEKPLGEVCEYVNGKAHERCIDEAGRFIVINSKFISTDGEVFKRSNDALLLLQAGEIAMVLSDVPNGKALAKCFLVEEANTYTLNQRICLIRSTKFHTKFLFYQLNRNRHFLSFDNGGNQTNMRLNQVLSCPLFLPPLAEQETIADTLDALTEETERLASLYEQKLAALDALKKSLLHQAFTGQL
jgi:type I restriction enzyme S subunit